jgi:hypothetical protein
MATWTIQISAQTDAAHTASGTHATTLGEAQPADFDGATINSVSVSGSPSTTVSVTDNDLLGVHFIIETSAGTDIYGTADGGGGSNDANTMCYAALSSSGSTITDGASTTPAPTTAVAADWDNVYWEVQYDAVAMQDATRTISWSQFNVVVDYSPAIIKEPGVVDPGLDLTGKVPTLFREYKPSPGVVDPGLDLTGKIPTLEYSYTLYPAKGFLTLFSVRGLWLAGGDVVAITRS